MKIKREILFTVFTFILCSFISVVFALINKFPLVYPDTGTYIVSGCEFELPFDRPVFYGLFLRFTSLKLSLWLTILAQAFLSVFLIREMIIYLTGSTKRVNLITIVIVSAISILSSYSYVVSELIADIFTSYIILCILLWQNEELTKIKRGIITLIFCYSLVTHNSHFLIVFSTLIALFIINYFAKLKNGKRYIQLLSFTIIILFLNLSFNYLKHKGFKLSRVTNTFLFARMLQTGAVHKYVEDHKELNDIVSNNINDIPQSSTEFLWNTDQSILYKDSCLPKKGWELCWCENDGLFKSYIKKVLMYAPSRRVYIIELSKSFLTQALFYKVEALGPLTTDYPVKINVKNYMKYDFNGYTNAIQYQRVLFFNATNTILFYTSILSLAILIFSVLYLKNKRFNILLLTFTIFYLLNAFICSSFSNTTERYTTRISWILILLALNSVLMIINKIKARSEKL